jgi:hypothetical protein
MPRAAAMGAPPRPEVVQATLGEAPQHTGVLPCGAQPLLVCWAHASWQAQGRHQPARRSSALVVACSPGNAMRQPRRAARRPPRRTYMLALPGATAPQRACDALCMHGTGSRDPARREVPAPRQGRSCPRRCARRGVSSGRAGPGATHSRAHCAAQGSAAHSRCGRVQRAGGGRGGPGGVLPGAALPASRGAPPAPQRRTVSCVPSLARLVCIACMRTLPMRPRGCRRTFVLPRAPLSPAGGHLLPGPPGWHTQSWARRRLHFAPPAAPRRAPPPATHIHARAARGHGPTARV